MIKKCIFDTTCLDQESHKTSIDPYRENIESFKGHDPIAIGSFKGHDPITAFAGGLDSQQLLTSTFPVVQLKEQLLRDQQMKFMQQQQQQQVGNFTRRISEENVVKFSR